MSPNHALSRRFATYQRFVERAPLGLAVMLVSDPAHPQTWKIVASNWLATHLVGSSAEAFLNGPIAVNLPALTSMEDLVRQTLRLGKIKALGPVAGRKSSPGLFTYWAKLFPIDDSCVGFSIEDQSLLRQSRDARNEAERQCGLISELARAILWHADPFTMQLSYVSPEGQQILGYWPERWLSETDFWKRHVHPDDLAAMVEQCAKARGGGYSDECEFRMISATGAVVWFRLLVRLAGGNNGSNQLLGVMTEITKLKDAEQHNKELSRRLIHLQDDEHRRISRELHDSLGQNLTALRMSLHALEQRAAPLDENAKRALCDAISLSEDAIQETRTVSYLLHPPVLDEFGLIKALDWFVDGFKKRSGIRVRLEAPSERFRLPTETELALFRVAQECLTNVHRHAHSRTAIVRIELQPNAIVLEIKDAGRGISEIARAELRQGKTGVGLSGIRERIAELNGKMEIDSDRRGTRIRVAVPASPQAIDEEEPPGTREILAPRHA